MTKKEQAQVDAMKAELQLLASFHRTEPAELQLLASFHRTEPVERDVPRPAPSSDCMSTGWDFNFYAMRVYKACSRSNSHGEGWERISSQGGRDLFSSKMRALKAMRYALERDCMTRLALIDRAIEQEEKECDQ